MPQNAKLWVFGLPCWASPSFWQSSVPVFFVSSKPHPSNATHTVC